ncbi:MAG: helix-turn-helix domain-containing protein, partial [Pseudonocardiaceae bacterium]
PCHTPTTSLSTHVGRHAKPQPVEINLRTREGMAIAKAKGRLRGKKPKLSPSQEEHLVELHRAGRHTTTELAELFTVARSTVYRAIHRARTDRS